MSAAEIYIPADILVARMMRRVVPRGACLVFTGARNSKGYGCVGSGRKSKSILVHRLAVIHRDGSIPEDMTVDHLCGERLCVNPEHLDVVTRSENSRRGRRPWIAAKFRQECAA